jgi:hypothetical protein
MRKQEIKLRFHIQKTKPVKGNNLSTGVKIAIGIGLIAAFIVILVIAGNSD